MKKQLVLENYLIRLRLVEMKDARFLFDLRQMGNRDKTVGVVNDYSKHVAWLENYLQLDNDYFFIGERLADGMPVGTVAVYNIDFNKRTAEDGRWLAWPGRGHAIAMLILSHEIGFTSLNLDCIYSRTMKRNRGVQSFLRVWGFEHAGSLEPIMVNGCMEQSDEYRVYARDWPQVKAKMERMLPLSSPVGS